MALSLDFTSIPNLIFAFFFLLNTRDVIAISVALFLIDVAGQPFQAYTTGLTHVSSLPCEP